MVGTNGYSSSLMVDYLADTIVTGNRERSSATSWYVNYPLTHSTTVDARPLWKEASSLWKS